jgi:hypothetical protein
MWKLCWGAVVAVVLAGVMEMRPGAGLVFGSTQQPAPAAQAPPTSAAAGQVDIASIEMGGRIESVTSEATEPDWVALNLIAKTPFLGWSAQNPSVPQEIVFSFLARQTALVAGVHINPTALPTEGGMKDVEIWTSTQSPTEGFTRVAVAALKNEDALQPIAFPPVEARFVKLRIVSAYTRMLNGAPAVTPAVASRVKILEGQRAGYVSILDRNPDLAALVKGVIPQAPASAAGPPLPAGGLTSCSVPAETPKKSAFPESRRVLVVASSSNDYAPKLWKPNRVIQKNDYSLYGRLEFSWITPHVATPALLLPLLKFDTVVLSQICEIDEIVSKEFKQALMAWVAAGHKLIIHDSDRCAAATGPRRAPDYSFLPYRFATMNPGAVGLRGEARLVESSTLASARPEEPSFLDIEAWVKETGGNGNELGDSNVIVKHDPHWCGVILGRNALKKSGFIEAYARYGRGLIIYDGIDFEHVGTPAYEQLVTRELAQPFDPDYLPCSQPLADFVITAHNEMKTQFMAAGKTYAYPLSVEANFGYSGRVTLEATVVPPDPAISVKLGSATADLTKVDSAGASLTVTTGPAATLKSKVIAVRGRDAAGKSNVLCLDLAERTSGSLTVVSGLTKDKKPTKNLEIILDASGSMKAMLGKKTRWATAQDVLKDVVSKLPKDFSVGLRAYGHTLASTNPKTCTDSALIVPVEPLNPATLLAAAGRLAPRGETPLVYSILQTPDDLKPVGGGTVILITDGEESCKGDFAAAAKALQDSGLNLILNIVGFTLKSVPAQAQLGGLAESTGGHYYAASSGEALASAVLLAAVDKLPYRILDAAGKEVAKGEAGSGKAHELPAGEYKVVITAADQVLTTPVTLAAAKDITLKATIKGDKLVVEK